jgi:hypothetical protein
VIDLKPRRIRNAAWSALTLAILLPAAVLAQPVNVDFRWTAPRTGGEVDHYNVYHIENDGPAVLTATEADTTFTLVASRGVRHRIRVSGVGEDGREGPLSLASDELYIEIPQTGDEIPGAPLLRPNFPNPFNPETTIVYGVPSTDGSGPDPVLEIYDVRGVRVRRLEVENAPGWHTVSWDGRDDTGIVRGSGQYVVRFACDGQVTAWKMTMLK